MTPTDPALHAIRDALRQAGHDVGDSSQDVVRAVREALACPSCGHAPASHIDHEDGRGPGCMEFVVSDIRGGADECGCPGPAAAGVDVPSGTAGDEALAALRELVELKDGPRGAEYEARKPLAWRRARQVLGLAGPAEGEDRYTSVVEEDPTPGSPFWYWRVFRDGRLLRDGYKLTAEAARERADQVVADDIATGAQTPIQAVRLGIEPAEDATTNGDSDAER